MHRSAKFGVRTVQKAYPSDATALISNVDRVRHHSESLARTNHRYADPLGLHLSLLAPFVLLFVGSWQAARGEIGIGAVAAIWGFWLRGSGALSQILNNVPELMAGLTACERATELLDESSIVHDSPSAQPLLVTTGSVVMTDVVFSYPTRPKNRVLDEFNLNIETGQKVALVGPSGAGKSTVAQLLLRFFDPASGRVEIDGQDLRTVTQKSVRSALGVVFQEPVFLSGSLARNLRLAKPAASEAEIVEALVASSAWDFVSAWSDGIYTELGEQGIMLFGGQRQRLAIARVMLRDPRIVVLDEATSALDASSESKVLEALDRLTEGRTSLVIAHRIATITSADRIFVVSQGRVVEEGTHGSLLQSSGIYQTYCREQLIA
jgi:ATP-binding cassette, subfamily B, bacterial